MKVFISWSQPDSAKVATALNGWLPLLFDQIEPWMSQADIGPGERWADKLGDELEEQVCGILCFTPSNVASDWMVYEAGALGKSRKASVVIPLLLGIEPEQLPEPLRQYQACTADREGIRALVGKLNATFPALDKIRAYPENVLDLIFDRYWPTLEEELAVISLLPSPVDSSSHSESSRSKHSARVSPPLQKKVRGSRSQTVYKHLANRLGIGHKRVIFEADVAEDGTAVFQREVEVECFIATASLDTFLFVRESVPLNSNQLVNKPKVYSADRHTTVRLGSIKLHSSVVSEVAVDSALPVDEQENRPYGRLLCDLIFDPAMVPGKSVAYVMIEESRKPVYLVDPSDSFGWSIYRPTQMLELRVNLPAHNIPKQITRLVTRATSLGFPTKDEIGELQRVPYPTLDTLTDGRHQLRLQVDYPVIGLVYRMRWSY